MNEALAPPDTALDGSAAAARRLRRRGVADLLSMGHCAPSVMRTLLDERGAAGLVDGPRGSGEAADPARRLVELTAGLPGGIGNTGGECGGITASLLLLGLRHGLDEHDGLPIVVDQGRELMRRFVAAHGTTSCREIRGRARVPLRCIGVVSRSPALCVGIACSDCTRALPAAQREAYRALYAHGREQRFHCALAVFDELQGEVATADAPRRAVSGFVGGTAFAGMTCSALAAGVMALGLAARRVEASRVRVVRMIATMALGGDAFADGLNAFNRVMNLGHELSRRFASRYGGTQCRAITGCDFDSADGVRRYVEGGGTARCAALAREVVTWTRQSIVSLGASRDSASAAMPNREGASR